MGKDLRALMEAHRTDILGMARRHGAANVRVFGSVARGEANMDSDLDLIVEMEPQHSAFFPGGLVADLEDLLGARVHVVTEKSLHPLLRKDVIEEAVPL